jgi:hypothetical protein
MLSVVNNFLKLLDAGSDGREMAALGATGGGQ